MPGLRANVLLLLSLSSISALPRRLKDSRYATKELKAGSTELESTTMAAREFPASDFERNHKKCCLCKSDPYSSSGNKKEECYVEAFRVSKADKSIGEISQKCKDACPSGVKVIKSKQNCASARGIDDRFSTALSCAHVARLADFQASWNPIDQLFDTLNSLPGALDTVGLFRVAALKDALDSKHNDLIEVGSNAEANAFMESLENSGNVHLVCGVIKRFLRDKFADAVPLKVDLKPDDLTVGTSDFIDDGLSLDNGHPLSPLQKAALKSLFPQLSAIAENHKKNKMKSTNLAIVIAPNLFNADVTDFAELAALVKSQNGIVTKLINDPYA